MQGTAGALCFCCVNRPDDWISQPLNKIGPRAGVPRRSGEKGKTIHLRWFERWRLQQHYLRPLKRQYNQVKGPPGDRLQLQLPGLALAGGVRRCLRSHIDKRRLHLRVILHIQSSTSLNLARYYGLHEVSVVDLSIRHARVLQDLPRFLLAQRLAKGVHDLLQVHLADVPALL